MTRRRTFAERASDRATREIGIPAQPLMRLPATRSSSQGRPNPTKRWGLVLGGGGVLGASWLIGALTALEEASGVDPRQAEIILGTSAGSVIGGLLAAGVSVADQRAQQFGEDSEIGRLVRNAFDPDAPVGDALPPRPKLSPGSPAMLKNNQGGWRRMPRTTILSALAPSGRGRMDGVEALIDAAIKPGAWPTHNGYRAVALDYETGYRTVFGAPGAPPAGLSEAVLASCAIPGWFRPVSIGGHPYVDGGVWSPTNLDLLVQEDLDEVVVLTPMASTVYDDPDDWRARGERRIRVRTTRRLLNEAQLVNRTGTGVTVFGPGPEDLALIGYNLMAADRRRAVLRSAIRTGRVAFTGPAAEGTAGSPDRIDGRAAGGADLTSVPGPAAWDERPGSGPKDRKDDE